jgi:hypothetical protein
LIKSPDDAFKLLHQLQAPQHLITHVTLVSEAAVELLQYMETLKLPVDRNLVLIGVALHDVGKIEFQEEMYAAGSRHEQAGQQKLLALGVDPAIAHCCVSHGQWMQMPCGLEELLIALSDKLWKGKRVKALEDMVIQRIVDILQKDFWDIFPDLDACFEQIAAQGDQRLARSINYNE